VVKHLHSGMGDQMDVADKTYEDLLQDEVVSAQSGDELARERLIRDHQQFISQVTGAYCKRRVYWGHDDELSVALLAFNEAIDAFDPGKGRSFTGFAKMIMQRRLVDHFRRQSRIQEVSLDQLTVDDPEHNGEFNPAEVAEAWVNYHHDEVASERAMEIEELGRLLYRYGISFEDLVETSPTHESRRETLNMVARTLMSEPVLMNSLLERKQLPQKALSKRTGVSKKVLTLGRPYIVALALLGKYRSRFRYLQEYFQMNVEGWS